MRLSRRPWLGSVPIGYRVHVSKEARLPGRFAGFAAPEIEQALAVAPRPGAAAFFDVDNTVVIGASISYLPRAGRPQVLLDH